MNEAKLASGMATGGVPLPTARDSESQVPQQLSELRSALHNLDDSISALEQRLDCVTRSDPPSPDNTKALVDPALVEVAYAVYDNRMTITRINTRITSLLDRMEL